jgi:hypothetical protein
VSRCRSHPCKTGQTGFVCTMFGGAGKYKRTIHTWCAFHRAAPLWTFTKQMLRIGNRTMARNADNDSDNLCLLGPRAFHKSLDERRRTMRTAPYSCLRRWCRARCLAYSWAGRQRLYSRQILFLLQARCGRLRIRRPRSDYMRLTRWRSMALRQSTLLLRDRNHWIPMLLFGITYDALFH